MSTLFCKSSDMTRFVYLRAPSKQSFRSSAIGSLLRPFDVSIDEHFVKAGLNDGRHKTTIISTNGLTALLESPASIQRGTHLNAFRIHLVVLLRPRPIKTSITLLVDKQIRVINLFEFKFDWFRERFGYYVSSFFACRQWSADHKLWANSTDLEP